MNSPSTSTIVRHDGIEMHVRETGDGLPVLLVHGFGSSAEAWQLTMPALARQHRVLAPDLPGMGRSTKTVRTPVLPFFCEWLVRLLDERGIAQTDFVGHSMGGRVALYLALTQPERIRKLVLVDSGGLGPTHPGFRAQLSGSVTLQALRQSLEVAFYDPKKLTDVALNHMLKIYQEPGATGVLETIAGDIEGPGAYGTDFTPQLPDIHHETLVLWGREDRIAPLANAERTRAMPHSRLHVFDQCGHGPQFEAQPAFNTVLTEFLRVPE